MSVPAPKRLLFAGLGTALTFGVGLGLGEAYVRKARPMPRAQVIRGGGQSAHGGHDIRMLHGQPTWEELGTTERRNLDCRTDTSTDVLMLGSSIFYGTSYRHDQVMSRHMQDALDATGDEWCVLNHGQPAMTSLTKMALAKEAIPRLRPDVVMWEMWHNDPGGFVMLGDDAYNLTEMVTDAGGYPVFMPMPATLRAWLFHHSQLFEYASLALTPRPADAYENKWRVLEEETLPELVALTEAHGGEVVLVFTPMLDVPFEESVRRHATKYRGYQWMAAWADEARIPRLDLAEVLVGQSVEALRHDPCCHWSAEGHTVVGKALADWVQEIHPD